MFINGGSYSSNFVKKKEVEMFSCNSSFKRFLSLASRYKCSFLDLSPEVESALQEKKAVVALETTIVTHGMPHPQNYETALTVERIIRDQVRITFFTFPFL